MKLSIPIHRALEDFIAEADEVLFEGNADRAGPMLDAYMRLKSLMAIESLTRLREYVKLHPELLDGRSWRERSEQAEDKAQC